MSSWQPNVYSVVRRSRLPTRAYLLSARDAVVCYGAYIELRLSHVKLAHAGKDFTHPLCVKRYIRLQLNVILGVHLYNRPQTFRL